MGRAFDDAWSILKMPYIMPSGRVVTGEGEDTLYQGNKRGAGDTRYWTTDPGVALAYAAFGSGSEGERQYRGGIPELRIAVPTDEEVHLAADPEFSDMDEHIAVDAEKITPRAGHSGFYRPAFPMPPSRVPYRRLPDHEMLELLLQHLAAGQSRVPLDQRTNGPMPLRHPYTDDPIEPKLHFDANEVGAYDYGGGPVNPDVQSHIYRLMLEMLQQGVGRQ